MPFLIRFSSCNFEIDTSPAIDPIFGFEQTQFTDTGLTSSQRATLRSLLTKKGGRRPGIDDRVHLSLHDGSVAEVQFVGLYSDSRCTEGIVVAEELTMPLLQLAIELASEVRLILRPGEFPRPLVVSEELRRTLLLRNPKVQAVFSAAMLWNLLVPRSMEPDEPME